MLVAGALALLIFVVAAIVGLLAVDMGRRENRHWIDALKSWQQLIGSFLGFLGAAGVLVLSTAIQSDLEVRHTHATSRSIGLGLAYEVQTLGVGLNTAQVVGHRDLAAADPGSKCLGFANAVLQALEPSAPVYNAVLPRLADFGDENLNAFVTFHSVYARLLRTVPDILAKDCQDPATDEYFLQYMVGQVDQGMYYYSLIAAQYGIAPPTLDQNRLDAPAAGGSATSASASEASTPQ